jgi:tetratricopeptide (TPR) repeat protein
MSASSRFLHKRRVVVALVVACIVAAAAVVSMQFTPFAVVAKWRAESLVERADAELASGDNPKAKALLREALQLDPSNRAARRKLADADLRLGQWELAFLELQTLTQLHPDDADAWIAIANVMAQSDLLESPEAALDRALTVDPKRADAHRLRGEIRFRLGRYYGAMRDAQDAVAASRKDAASWALLVRSTVRVKGADAAIAAANEGLATAGRLPPLLLAFSGVLSDAGRFAEALSVLNEIGESPKSTGTRLAMASIKLRQRDTNAARQDIDAILTSQEGNEQAIALRAVAAAQEGAWESALAQLDAALQRKPPSPGLRAVRARLQSVRSDPQSLAPLVLEVTARESSPAPARKFRPDAQRVDLDAIDVPRESWPGRLAQIRQALEVELRKQNWAEAQRIADSARHTYGEEGGFAPWLAGIVALAQGNVAAAEKHLHESSAAAPRSPLVLAGLAKVWSRKNGASFAGEQLMAVAEHDPGFAFARFMASRAYVDARDPDRAEAALKRGLALQPQSPLPHRQLAHYYLGLDQAPEALAVVDQGLQQFPGNIELRLLSGDISRRVSKINDAVAAYESVLSDRPDLDLVAYKVADVLASQDQPSLPPRAFALLQQLRNDLPSDPLLVNTLGWLHLRNGDVERARELLEVAARSAPEDPTLRFRLATVYAREGKMDPARENLQMALVAKQPFAERVDALRLMREIGGSPASFAPSQ